MKAQFWPRESKPSIAIRGLAQIYLMEFGRCNKPDVFSSPMSLIMSIISQSTVKHIQRVSATFLYQCLHKSLIIVVVPQLSWATAA
jgi:hypothetical protein